MNTIRTQQIIITKNNKYWKQIDDLSFAVKNLYNAANYIVRQEFIKTSKEKDQGARDVAHYINFYELDPMMQSLNEYRVVGSKIAQQTLRMLDRNWKSFFSAIKNLNKNKDNYLGKPNMPKYLDKYNGRYPICLVSQNVKNKDGYLYFSLKSLKNMNNIFRTIRPEKIQALRIVPSLPNYIVEILYKIEVSESIVISNRIASIDLGVNNLLTVVNNCQEECFAINGKPLKSMNQYYNKVKAKKQSSLMIKNNKHHSKAINNLTIKRNNKVKDYIHKASKYVIDWCVSHNIDTLVCGYNKGWKQKADMGKINNQNFINIPYNTLIRQLAYKCEDKGIKFIEIEEEYTSGTSFLDNEEPIKENYDKSRRKNRGLFISNEGVEINADVNGAYQIMKKVFPNAFANGIEGVGLHPIIINIIK